MVDFIERRRQKYLDEESFKNTVQHLIEGKSFYEEMLNATGATTRTRARALSGHALDLWRKFQIEYTAGVDLPQLAESLGEIIEQSL